MYKVLLFIVALFLFSGCASNHPPLKTVEKVDLERYKGTWYEIARYDQWFEEGCSHVTANYSFKENGDIKVVNRCKEETGIFKESIGSAYSENSENTQLKVTFFWPFYGDYWVIMLDDDYSYAVVGSPSRKYLWILSRTPRLDAEKLEKIKTALPEYGYSLEPILWTKQD